MCNECFADSLGIAITVVLLLLIMVAIAAALSYALVENANAAHTGFVDRVMRFIPLQSIKIVIVVWQIVTQVMELLTKEDGTSVSGTCFS